MLLKSRQFYPPFPKLPEPPTHHDYTCYDKALFMGGIDMPAGFFVAILFLITSICLTLYLRYITPGTVSISRKVKIAAGLDDTETPTPDEQELPEVREEATEGSPPPYQSASNRQDPSPATTIRLLKTKQKLSSAHLFVLGTIIVILLIFSVFCLALMTQCLIYCQDWSPVSTFPRIVLWTIFTMLAMLASIGVSSWAMLFRNLWGVSARKKYPFTEFLLVGLMVRVIIGPLIYLNHLAVSAIQACQTRLCKDAIDEDEEDGLSSERHGVELGEFMREGSSTVRDSSMREEVRGLIDGMEK
jgi:hypothetical protein